MKSTNQTQPIKRLFLTRADLKAMGIWQSNSTLLRLESAKRFPRRIRIAGASVCWDHDEIMAWVQARKAERARWCYADAS